MAKLIFRANVLDCKCNIKRLLLDSKVSLRLAPDVKSGSCRLLHVDFHQRILLPCKQVLSVGICQKCYEELYNNLDLTETIHHM